MTIVTTTYRYKPPPKRKGRKLAKITGPAVIAVKGSRRPGPLRGGGQAAAEVRKENAHPQRAGDAQSSTKAPVPANDGRKSAIVTARKPQTWRSDVPDTTPEEYRRRGDTADALFREMKHKIADALRPDGKLPPSKS
jgi:hypothetical protein